MKYVVLDDFASGSVRLQAGAVLDDAEHNIASLVQQGASLGPVPTAAEASVAASIAAYLNQRGVGERELVPYGSMLSNALSSNAGASFVKTLSGMSVEDALTGSSPGGVFVFRPGAVAPDLPIYNDWATLWAALLAFDGPREVYLDASVANVTIPAGTWDFGDGGGAFLSATGFSTTIVTCADGCQIANLTRMTGIDLRSISNSPVITAADYTIGGVASAGLIYLLTSSMQANGTAPLALINDTLLCFLDTNSSLKTGAAAVMRIEDTGGAFPTLITPLLTYGQIQANTVDSANPAEVGLWVPFFPSNLWNSVSFDQPGLDLVAGSPRENSVQTFGNQTPANTTTVVGPATYALGTGGNSVETVLVDASAGPVTINIPSPAAAYPFGAQFEVISTVPSTNQITVNAYAGDTINGAPSDAFSGAYERRRYTFGHTTDIFMDGEKPLPAGVPYAFIFRPGDPSPGPGVYTSWVAMMADYAAAVSPPLTFVIDNSLAPTTVPAGSYTVSPAMTWRSPLLSQPSTLIFEDGATINTVPICQGLALRSDSSTPVVTANTPYGVLSVFGSNSFVAAHGTAPFFLVQDATVITLADAGTFAADTSPVLQIDGTLGFTTCVLSLGENAAIQAGTIATTGAAENGMVFPILLNDSNPGILWDQPGYDSVAGPLNSQLQHGTVKRDGIQFISTDTQLDGMSKLCLVDTSGGPVNITLLYLAAVMPAGYTFGMKKLTADADTVTFTPTAPNVVNGAASYSLTLQNQVVYFTSDGVNEFHITGGYLI